MSVAFGTAADGRCVTRVGDAIFDAGAIADSLDALLARPHTEWELAIEAARAGAADGSLPRIGAEAGSADAGGAAIELALPFTIGDYVDFYSSLEHATFFGRLLRPEGDPLLPNWRRMPVGYHGRASTVVVSGTPIRRPLGQTPDFGPTRALDVEVELGFVVGGPPNALGEPIPIERAGERIFGVVLLNDWSARDIQRFEGQPLGPFLSKAFATSISPWVVPIAQLERVPGPNQDPPPLPYLTHDDDWNLDVELTVEINGDLAATTNSRTLYWSAAQQLAHLASGGAVVRPGDLFGTGTISGGTQDSGGSLMEMGRPFLDDSDEIVIRGRAGTTSLGEVRGRIEPPIPY